MKIMLIEDEPMIREELSFLLQNSGYTTTAPECFTGIPEAVIQEQPDLILLDINLPGTDGYTLCREIRAGSNVPVIFLTSQNTSMDELKALTLGGDDFIAKPYHVPVLLARIQSVLRRHHSTAASDDSMEHKGIVLYPLAGKLSFGSQSVDLTKNETKTLYCLFKQKGNFVSRSDIIDYLWDNEVYIDDNTLSVNITRIRDKLREIGVENNFIQTKRGMGYRI